VCAANGKEATAAVTQYGYRRGGFFEGYEPRRENRVARTALLRQMLRSAAA